MSEAAFTIGANPATTGAVSPRDFFTPEQVRELEKAIRGAESRTSGEIRIHLESACADPIVRATEVFEQLGMSKTRHNTGVLIYVAIVSQQFTIIADSGISRKVPGDFWDNIRDIMEAEFRQGRFLNGLRFGIEVAGIELAKFFPRPDDDTNELPDTLSYGN
ncbi:MAG TPA: TPM domain-containing protein [Candidatus Ozemobacteraceae bacterium]|nr:TPM domain-containing protein [Candidatus Ozemobacteraceae bacterium]